VAREELQRSGGGMSNQPEYHHLAELNFGTLRHDWDDPRVRDFVEGLDLVNSIAERSPGFVWRLPDDQMEAAQTDPSGPFGDNPRVAATLSVWQDAESLDDFVWNTVHRQFYERRTEWYGAIGNSNLVMWWVPMGHRPGVEEGMERFRLLSEIGNSDDAFNWAWLEQARQWRVKNCSGVAAE
jgi:Domain of unknown function (DUF3291)